MPRETLSAFGKFMHHFWYKTVGERGFSALRVSPQARLCMRVRLTPVADPVDWKPRRSCSARHADRLQSEHSLSLRPSWIPTQGKAGFALTPADRLKYDKTVCVECRTHFLVCFMLCIPFCAATLPTVLFIQKLL